MESGMITVKYDDLLAAFDFVSFGAPFEHRAFVSRDTGAVYWISETNPIEEEELPDDLETSDRYIAIPHKTEPYPHLAAAVTLPAPKSAAPGPSDEGRRRRRRA